MSEASEENEGVVAEGGRVVPSEEVARTLDGLSAFMRKHTGDGEHVRELDDAATMARSMIGMAKEKKLKEMELVVIPKWAEDIEDVEDLFVKKGGDSVMWHPVAETIRKGERDVLVTFERLSDVLSPGGTAGDQPIPLEYVNNRFHVDEWKQIVQPILERYVDSLELRIFAKGVAKKQRAIGKRIKVLIPQVFRGNEFPDLSKVDLSKQEIRREVLEYLNDISMNPEILEKWIKEQLGGEPSGNSNGKLTSGLKRLAYGNLQEKQALKRIEKRYSDRDVTREDYIAELMGQISELGAQLLFLNVKHRTGVYKVPKVKPDFVETPYFQDLLKSLTEKVARQLREKKGMVSIIGEMGTGKNYLVEHFAANTNRPFFYFPCSRGMDAADLGFHFEFKEGESMVVPSNLAKGLRTENAVILIDEPNSLPPEVVAGLHGLADHNRAFVYNGVEFKAASGVAIVMTMNPATYAHVKDLPEAFCDRTLGQDMVMGYPPLTKLDKLAQDNLWSDSEKETALHDDNSLDKEFVCDEALILKNVFPDLKKWTNDDFMKLWDVVVNKRGESLLEGAKANEIDKHKSSVMAIFQILTICNRWRAKYKLGDMQRTISLRGSSSVAKNWLRENDVRKAFLSLYSPNRFKYDGGQEDYEDLEMILNEMEMV